MIVIGDVHGKIGEYIDITKDNEYTLQLGDMGFNYVGLNRVDYKKHKFIMGNHDNHNEYPQHYLGRFGYTSFGGLQFFYISGAFSIDFSYRIHIEQTGGGKSWWINEELNFSEMMECLELYKKLKPDIVISHTCPAKVQRKVQNPKTAIQFGFSPDFCGNTEKLLEKMRQYHKPKLHIFGHWHQSQDFVLEGTRFVCLNELETFEVQDVL